MKKCNGPDMESKKGWFTLFPVAPFFSVKFFFPYLLRGVELGQPEKRNDAVPRFSWKEPILPVIMEEGSWFTERA